MRRIVLVAAVAAAVLIGGTAPDARATPRLTPWTNSTTYPFTVGANHVPYTSRVVGTGKHVLSTMSIGGCTRTGMARTYVFEVMTGHREWRYGNAAQPGTVYRRTMNAQQVGLLFDRFYGRQKRGHFASVDAFTARAERILTMSPEALDHAVEGDLPATVRKQRARDELAEVVHHVAFLVRQTAAAYQHELTNPLATGLTDPRAIDLSTPEGLEEWGHRWGGLSRDDTLPSRWELMLQQKASAHEGSFCDRESIPTLVAYHRGVRVEGTAAAWTATVVDREDEFSIAYSSATGRTTSTP